MLQDTPLTRGMWPIFSPSQWVACGSRRYIAVRRRPRWSLSPIGGRPITPAEERGLQMLAIRLREPDGFSQDVELIHLNLNRIRLYYVKIINIFLKKDEI